MRPERTMARTLLVRGMLVGLAAGVIAFFVAHFFGEPSIDAAIAVEKAGHVHMAGEVEVVSRAVQSTAGLLTALLGDGVAIGGLFGLAFAVAQGRLGQLGARTRAGLIALVGFVTIAVVPFIKYPANPPSVGSPQTLDRRTALYFSMMLLSILAASSAVWLSRQIHRFSGWDRALSGVGIYVVLVTICMAILPPVNEVGPNFPASTLWGFRTGSFLTQLAVWATLGLLFGALTERAERAERGQRAVASDRTPATAIPST
jgi:Probable cobalt transporter subunit (CbtA)